MKRGTFSIQARNSNVILLFLLIFSVNLVGLTINKAFLVIFRLYQQKTPGDESDDWNLNIEQGDRVGCGFEPVDKGKVDPVSKIPCAGQTLMIYFTVNGKKVILDFNIQLLLILL